MADAASHQTFGTPTAHTTHAEDDDAFAHDKLHRLIAHKQVETVEYGVLYTHNVIEIRGGKNSDFSRIIKPKRNTVFCTFAAMNTEETRILEFDAVILQNEGNDNQPII